MKKIMGVLIVIITVSMMTLLGSLVNQVSAKGETVPVCRDYTVKPGDTLWAIAREHTDGNYVVVKQQNYANNGDIVVALIEDEATVKRFYKEKDHIRLQPENSLMEPILVQQVTILGKVTGVFRRL
jgi:hypothetical protein